VEDNLINQKLTSTILHHNGFEVSIAKNGRKAIEMLKESSPDLILMDIQMPVLDGYRTTQLIRDELHIGTPIIAMTAHALSGERDKCLKAGMNDYLAKPFREADLLDKIAYWATLAAGNQDPAHPSFKRIDLSFLLEQTRNNKTFIREMIRIFLKQYPKDHEKLKNAISKQDYKQIYKTVHALRNTVGLFGLSSSIGNPLLEMEKLALANEKMEAIQQLFNKVIPLFEEAVRELELFKNG
jgi:CheY-like chemotaxis protein